MLRRYILDGDRDELRNIRHELATLRDNVLYSPHSDALPPRQSGLPDVRSTSADLRSSAADEMKREDTLPVNPAHIRRQIGALEATGLYTQEDEVIKELYSALSKAESRL